MADPVASDPGTESSDYVAMKGAWEKIEDILAGVETIRLKTTIYLPQYEDESDTEYNRRVVTASWRPEFDDALRNLAAKPFEKDVAVQGKPSSRMTEITDDVDGRGNNITAFSRETFRGGVGKGVHAILVDYPDIAPSLTQAEERAAGARPYWVQYPAESIIALYTSMRGGRQVVDHVRLRETFTAREGFGEVTKTRIRVLEPGKFWIYERDDKKVWTIAKQGVITLDEVPLVLFFTAERKGQYRVKPPMLDLANMQIELYQQLALEDEILTYAGSPMLKAKGMAKPKGEKGEVPQIALGPKRILFAPPGGEGSQPDWDFIQPDAANIKEVREKTKSIVDDMRRLGMQPLTDKTGSVTATGSSIEAAKAHSTCQAWAIALKDVLEQALLFTAQWEKTGEKTVVSVHTDFGVDLQGVEEMKILQTMRQTGDLSQQTLWDEGQRRNLLGPQFDADKERALIQEEPPALGTMLAADPNNPNDPSNSDDPANKDDPNADDPQSKDPNKKPFPKAA